MKFGRRSSYHPIRATTNFQPLDTLQHVTLHKEAADISQVPCALSTISSPASCWVHSDRFFGGAIDHRIAL
jgi:hypothetical protein